MVRTRSSQASQAGDTAVDFQLASENQHEANISNMSPPGKRLAPSKAFLTAAAAASDSKNDTNTNTTNRNSLSSVTPSIDSSAYSPSGHSTPSTSNMTTPLSSILTDRAKVALNLSTQPSKIEVIIPVIKTRKPAAKSIQIAADEKTTGHVVNTSSNSSLSKRKKDFISNTAEDDYPTRLPSVRQTRHDEHIARQLQEELYREATEAPTSENVSPHHITMASGDGESSKPNTKGKATAVAPRRRQVPHATAKRHSDLGPQGDEDEEVSVEFTPPAKRRKRASATKESRTHTLALPDSDDNTPMPAKRRSGGKIVGNAAGKAKASAEDLRPQTPALGDTGSDDFVIDGLDDTDDSSEPEGDGEIHGLSISTTDPTNINDLLRSRRGYRAYHSQRRHRTSRMMLEAIHPQLITMWNVLETTAVLKAGEAEQPKYISRLLKPFQLEGLAWMKAMEKTDWKGGLLGDEMGLGKTIQAVALIMSDYPAKQPSLVLVPPVALMQWVSEIDSYTDGTLKTLVYHGTNAKSKGKTVKDLKEYDIIIMSYNSLESMYRKQEKGFTRRDGIYKEKSVIHAMKYHRVVLDEAHCIKTRTTMTAKACFALKADYRWCLTGTPLQNRIGEFFSLIRFLNIQPFTSYFCKACPCETLEWTVDDDHHCTKCMHNGMQHISVFNHELLNPIQRYGNTGPGTEALRKLRMLTDHIMLRRLKKDYMDSMELPVKEIYVDRQFFGIAENDLANSIMTNGQREFDTYVAHGVLLNNYANIFGLIMQMRQVADHPDLILKKNAEGGQNILVCCICDEPAEEAIRSRCKHDFCRSCARSYLRSQDQPDCPQCHIALSIDLEQPAMEQDEIQVKKSSIINRIKMENWTSSSKIELLVHELHKLRSDKASHKSIIFSQFTTMLQLIEWRLRRAGITTVMLDGSMTPAQRAASIDHFMKNVDVECFLVSLKAGGVALNLTEASRVFIVDPWWNPAAEWQSADRCHRIGQTRPCTITRLCIEDSVESRMVLLQEKKSSMINSTINKDDAAMESLTPGDLQFLFRGN